MTNQTPFMKRHGARLTGSLLFLAAFAAATWPAWRLLFIGPDPTLEELLQIICSKPA